jgi:S-phase kinase-associated protein 1
MVQRNISLKSSDDQVFTIDRVVAEQSVLLKNMLEDVEGSEHQIPLPNVTGKVLQKVIDYCVRHTSSADLEEWDGEYIDVRFLLSGAEAEFDRWKRISCLT